MSNLPPLTKYLTKTLANKNISLLLFNYLFHTLHTGLDSASSLDILRSLSVLAETGRAVVVTIHQPRSEIFHSFDKILLLCKGQVAFFGSPIKVWDFFTQALNYEDESSVSERSYVYINVPCRCPLANNVCVILQSDVLLKYMYMYMLSFSKEWS